MRKALCVGINSYARCSRLYGCVNDATAVAQVLSRHGDGRVNFDVSLMCAEDFDSQVSCQSLKAAIRELFDTEAEIAVFYFSGHGAIDAFGGYLCASDIEQPDEGVSLEYVMRCAESSNSHNNIIILDSCHSGAAGSPFVSGTSNNAWLKPGTTILAACGRDAYATERNGHGVFTDLLVEALEGGAMNLLGDVTPGSIYSYIDRSLGAWDQRPIFKANIQQFITLRNNSPQISIANLRKIIDIFPNPDEDFPLDPTYEPDKHEVENKCVNREHEATFDLLQDFVKLNLVVPVGEKHMYYAAIHSRSCRLTAQGRHYWKLAKNDRI